MSGKKIFISGTSGMLGSNLLHLIHNDNIVGCGRELDITDAKKLGLALKHANPDIIIHAAANTDVEGSEKNRNEAYRINTLGTQNLVNFCIEKDILFVYLSSTGIYGREKEKDPYDEFDNSNPTTIHHKSKFEAEKIVKSHIHKHLIIRTV